MRVLNEDLGTKDAATSFVSHTLLLEHAQGYMIQSVITGSPVGELKLQGSSDEGEGPQGTDVTNWFDITGSTATVNGAGDVVWNARGPYYKWVRVAYAATSGSGEMVITGNAKGF